MSLAVDRTRFLSLVAVLAACAPAVVRPSEGLAPASSAPLPPDASSRPTAAEPLAAPAAPSAPEDAGASGAPDPKAAEDSLGFDGDTIDHVDVPECARFSWWSCDEVTPPALRCSLTWNRLSASRRGAYAECLRAAPKWPRSAPAPTCRDHACSRLHVAASRASRRLAECVAGSKAPQRACSAETGAAEETSRRASGCTKRAQCGEDLSSCVEQSRYLEACERAKASR
ncbi:MAG: hypothetical protein IPF92_05780 [Myxococcales bacterium]|jgi:hypothetical protein|nr:hypothetical protein [Myxococcales bacterium]MBL0198079.1 hypothetical protein [Myxococcales bacterium]HQY61585.1 hypothetical protein [Polyangiaceae bacterium]